MHEALEFIDRDKVDEGIAITDAEMFSLKNQLVLFEILCYRFTKNLYCSR